ncbi:hypothetical protein EIP91_009904 [Steccherinum ochraceum]|uniref:LYC1 C-terminal domain-containing protein n=1 Tax=Steccherinum ochraceum TaxID=92696 RepID=A0A4R0RXB7_9APHY|nr:hypothetical protein EIP91_009904 [Steccherinum ochraceum]
MSSPSLDTLTIYPATPEQTLESRKRSAVEWSKGRSLEQYVERDRIMDDHPHASNGRLTTWVLAPRNDPATLDFMCSCETFARDSIVVRRSSLEASAELEDVVGYGVASVFTPESQRRKGYAGHMMRLLHWVLAPHPSLPAFPTRWGSPPPIAPSVGNATFSVLYSDVGSTFYHNCGPDERSSTGWAVQGTQQTIWHVSPPSSHDAPLKTQWQGLSLEDVEILYDTEAQTIRQEIANDAPVGVGFSFLPNKGVGLFNINRTMRFSGDSLSSYLPFDKWGVVLKDGDNIKASATWTLDGSALVVTRLRVSPDQFSDLLQQLQHAARGMNARTVEIWNMAPSLQVKAESLGGVTGNRDEHLPAFKWYGKEDESELHWFYNEKYVEYPIS